MSQESLSPSKIEQEQAYCQFNRDICTERMHPDKPSIFFAYPSKPKTSSEAMQRAIRLLSEDPNFQIEITDWQELPVEGNIIFCEICHGIMKSNCTVLNTTRVNFNIMFEYGFAVGAGRAIWPLVEEGVAKADRIYDSIATLTTIGYSKYSNSRSIYTKLKRKKPWERPPAFSLPQTLGTSPTRDTMNLLYLQNIYDNEPSLRISEALSAIPMRKIMDNPREDPFPPLSWYLKSISRSHAVIIHLGSEMAEGYVQHCAKCALVAGMTLALGRRLLILGENPSFKPIDYHDIIRSYDSAKQAGEIVSEFIWPINNIIFDFSKHAPEDTSLIKRPEITKDNILESIDLGEYTAENEDLVLADYFVETPEFMLALKPTHKVFIGRRGTGKTANFYMIMDKFEQDKRNIVCNIKPEEWQLDELLHFVKSELNIAQKGYLLQSLWKYMVYSEVIKSCFDRIKAKPIHSVLSDYEKAIINYVEGRKDITELSFISRLVNLVRGIIKEFDKEKTTEVAVSEVLHGRDIGRIHDMLMNYVQDNKGNCIIVIDSLDANWKLGRDYKIMAEILLSLIETTQDMWRACTKDLIGRISDKGLSILIFLRTDIFKTVLEVAREPDKLQPELISWKDMNELLDVVNRRILADLDEYGVEILDWREILDSGLTVQEMLLFLTENILCKPRDLIYFFQRCFYHARSRGVNRLGIKDFANAMKQYSEHAFKSLCAETQPYIPSVEGLLIEFAGAPSILSFDAIKGELKEGKINNKDVRKTVDYLIESNFLGVKMEDSVFHFPVTPTGFSIAAQKIWSKSRIHKKPSIFKIHNAFHSALFIVQKEKQQ